MLSVLLGSTQAIELNVDDPESIKAAASTVAWDLVSWYSGNETGQSPGMLPDPYYWWAAGAMFGSLIDYWYYTGDDTYNEITTQGVLFQSRAVAFGLSEMFC
jgi:mannan endo-1,6-alpha-mannosidase